MKFLPETYAKVQKVMAEMVKVAEQTKENEGSEGGKVRSVGAQSRKHWPHPLRLVCALSSI